MAQASINGTSIHYQQRGRGPAVVLLHGFPLDMRVWEEQSAALADAYRVVRVDLRGFGQSAASGPFSIEALADDVNALAKRMDLCPFVLGGLSMGGYVALAYARKYPMDLAGLILADTRAAGDTADGKKARNEMAELARNQGAKAVADRMEPKMLAAGTRARRPEVYALMRQMMEGCSPQTIAHACLAMRDRGDLQDELPSIPCPTLIVCGEEDVSTGPEPSRAMQRAIPDAEMAIIAGAGHLSPMEMPDAVTAEMRRFLEKVYGGNAGG